MQLDGVVALVTGGASGLGRATAIELAGRGADVVVLGLPAARERVEREGRFAFVAADVRDERAVQAAVDAAAARGPLRVVVNCAGVGLTARIVRRGTPHALADFQRTVDVNLVGTFNVMRLAVVAMQRSERLRDGENGVIVNTASIAAYDGQIGQAAYAASKGGVVALTLTAARDLASAGIRVVTIAPGLFETPLFGDLPQPTREALAASVPHPSRLGVPHEFAALARHIVENPMLNGEVIRLDAAFRMGPR
ncbi:SDR family NAD(P)-dependent oxidoreductase [Conexibacter sp. CPCC 206217]|uniref:SDR family NAD(P)-dependent oxidoreductase n=1 Tax=Conexibacter sp. CPCC 206217 TaxID=3064574 RepID=UPI00272469A5|nr:SDR family NAD(P)-dependent oxidoreductase [Conexibacter sp. CPCC 206217]MDO8208898.1 SDR family NAD(P)-dependent oxidoreductase [Conexibacter sp. CPCC 206217]